MEPILNVSARPSETRPRFSEEIELHVVSARDYSPDPSFKKEKQRGADSENDSFTRGSGSDSDSEEDSFSFKSEREVSAFTVFAEAIAACAGAAERLQDAGAGAHHSMVRLGTQAHASAVKCVAPCAPKSEFRPGISL